VETYAGGSEACAAGIYREDEGVHTDPVRRGGGHRERRERGEAHQGMSSGDGVDAGRGAAPKRLKVASAFELPQRLGVLRRVERRPLAAGIHA